MIFIINWPPASQPPLHCHRTFSRDSRASHNFPFWFSNQDPGFQITFAITIAIKNRSGKIADRF
jgi:hypothetical protein